MYIYSMQIFQSNESTLICEHNNIWTQVKIQKSATRLQIYDISGESINGIVLRISEKAIIEIFLRISQVSIKGKVRIIRGGKVTWHT